MVATALHFTQNTQQQAFCRKASEASKRMVIFSSLAKESKFDGPIFFKPLLIMCLFWLVVAMAPGPCTNQAMSGTKLFQIDGHFFETSHHSPLS